MKQQKIIEMNLLIYIQAQQAIKSPTRFVNDDGLLDVRFCYI